MLIAKAVLTAVFTATGLGIASLSLQKTEDVPIQTPQPISYEQWAQEVALEYSDPPGLEL